MHNNASTYTPPILVINVALLDGTADLVLPLLRQLLETINHLEIAIDEAFDVLKNLGSNTAPVKRSLAVSRTLAISSFDEPVPVGPRRVFLKHNHGGKPNLALLNLDACLLALSVLAGSPLVGRDLCESGQSRFKETWPRGFKK